MDTRERMREFVETQSKIKSRAAWDLQMAANKLQVSLSYLEIATNDVLIARDEYVNAQESVDRQRRGRKVGVYWLTAEEAADIVRYDEAIPLLAFRIETFLIQARMVLDRIARLLHFAFRPAQTSLSSHRNLTANLKLLAAEHDVDVPESLLMQITELTIDVKDFRDKHLVHPSGQRGHRLRTTPTVGPATGETRLKVKWADPPDEDPSAPIHSADVEQLYARLLTYLDEILDFIESARSRN